MARVLIVSPTYFSPESFIGGAERYVEEFANEISKTMPTILVSFGEKRDIIKTGFLKKTIYKSWSNLRGSRLNPLNLIALKEILSADVIYIHGVCTMMSDLFCLFSRFLGKTIYVMDHGGGAEVVLNRRIPVFSLYTGGVAQSDLAATFLPKQIQDRTTVIKGGIDVGRFKIDSLKREKKRILFVGRILSHKGIDQLLIACTLFNHRDWKLIILGNPYDTHYDRELRKQAEGYPIEFIQGADDERLMEEYQKASVLVLPSTKLDCYGRVSTVPELMGFVLMEAQACGVPVICTDVGATREFVDEGETGFVVGQNQPERLHQALEKVFELWELQGESLGLKCRKWISQFSWETVVTKHKKLFLNEFS